MITARAVPRQLSVGLLMLAALIALAMLTLSNSLTVITPSMSHRPATTITSPDQPGPQEPAPSVRYGGDVSTQGGADQPPVVAPRGVTRFADGGPGVAPALSQHGQTCTPKCPQRPAR